MMMRITLATPARVAALAGLVLLAPGLARGQPPDDVQRSSRAYGDEALPLETEAYQHLFNYDFEAAEEIFERLDDQFPDFAAGPYGHAAVIWTKVAQRVGAMRGSSHRGDRYWEQSGIALVTDEEEQFFEDQLGEAKRRGERVRQRDPGDLLNLYYLGAVESIKAAWDGTVQRAYFSAGRAMRRAASLHREVLEADPDFADAYHAPGAQDYAIATLPRALRMLAFLFGMRGEKERGLDWVARTAREGQRSRWGALWALVLFMQREERMDDALTAVRTLREQFPRNPDFALEEIGIRLHHGETAEARDALLVFIERRDAGFGNYHLTTRGIPELRLGESWLFEESWEEAEAAFSQGLQSSPPPDVRLMLHFRRGNARDGLGQRQPALFDYNRVRQLGGDKVLERWAKDLRKTPWPEGAPEGSRPH